MPLFVAGVSHRNAPVELREQLAVDKDKLREVLRDIAATGVVREALILSTCNRVEVYAVAEVPGEARAATFRHLCSHRGVDSASVDTVLYTHTESEAVRHAFRVAASLDSMMLGEPQILGQVKDAFALAQSCETIGPALHTLFTQAFAVAKKVRTETEIARHAVSVSFAAVELAKKIFAGLVGRGVLLVGAGKMSELAARHLIDQGAFPLYVANRTWARAQELARALAGTAVPFDELPTALAAVDIVIASTGAPDPVIKRETVSRVIPARRGRPLFFIDIAVPRLLLRHRRPEAGRGREHPGARPRGASGRGARRARGREVSRQAGRRRGDSHDRLAARAARGDPRGRGQADARPAPRRHARNPRRARGDVVRNREQDPARADHQAPRVLPRRLAPFLARASPRALRSRPGKKRMKQAVAREMKQAVARDRACRSHAASISGHPRSKPASRPPLQ